MEITDIEGNFSKLRVRLQKTNEWPRGVFKEWSYWSHGGDIEFDNESTNEHFNVAMSNIRSLKYWSLHKYILGTNMESELGIFLMDRKETIIKIFDVLVIKKKLCEIRTEFGEKQYELS